MAILGKIRERSIFLILVIGMALFAFVISGVFDGSGSISQDPLAKVGDEEITLEQFSPRVDFVERNYGMTTLQAVNFVWDQVVNETAFKQQLEKLGLDVGRNHVADFVSTDPNFMQDSRFQNAIGQFDLNAFSDFISDLKANNPSGYAQWQQQESSILDNLRQRQYVNMVRSGINYTQFEGAQAHALENDKINIEYIKIPYTAIADSLFTVTDSEIKKYISQNEDTYQRDASRNIEYVVFEEKASVEDNLELEASLKELLAPQTIFNEVTQREEVIPSFSETNDISEFVSEYSDVPYDGEYQTKAQLGTYANTLFDLKEGVVFGPYKDGEYFKISRLMDFDKGGSVKARHILISYQGSQNAGSEISRSKDEARQEAYRVLRLARGSGSDFSELARTYSDGPSKNRGGELGFFKRGAMVEAFNDFVFSKAVGSKGVVETEFGYHVIEVQDKEDVVLLASVAKKIVPSEATSNQVFRAATQFELNSTNDGFSSASQAENYAIKTASNLKELDENIPGLGAERNIVRWVYSEDASVGAIKRFNKQGGGYVVARVSASRDEGLASVGEVRSEVSSILLKQKKIDYLQKEHAGTNDLSSIASTYNITVNTSSAINATAGTIAGAGTEPGVIGASFGLQVGETSSLVEGKQGVFLVKLTDIQNATPLVSYQGYNDTSLSLILPTIANKLQEVVQSGYELVDNRSEYY
jgi:peptidyl-prolyl cis-trans isomerase D